MSGPSVFIVLPTDALGGAEKRFAGLWLWLREQGHLGIHLVVPRPLKQALSEAPEFKALPQHEHAIVTFDSADARPLKGQWRQLNLLRLRHPRAVFHYTLLPPALLGLIRPDRTVFTIPNSSLDRYNLRGLLPVLASALVSGRVDVLDEDVLGRLKGWFPFRTSALRLTPNSFVDVDYYQPKPKKLRLAFTGLFSLEKQAARLVDAIPAVDAALKAKGLSAEFRLMGREVHGSTLGERCAALRPQIDVQAGYEPNPVAVLAEARIFFSLQRANNYPSKALLEAMACGCIPIVTDVGTTRRIAPQGIASFVPREFTPEQLAEKVVQILTLPDAEQDRRAAAARQFVREKFSVESMANYYLGLWRELLPSVADRDRIA